MLEIMLYPDQRSLLPELQRLFPDLSQDRFFEGRRYYLASLCQGEEGIRQRTFLHAHHLDYIERTRQCEQSIRAFFAGVELDGRPIDWIEVEPVPNASGAHLATVKTANTEVSLYFPPQWDPVRWRQDRGMFSWLYIYQAAEQTCASPVGMDGHVTKPIIWTGTAGEMAQWLREREYTQAICTTLDPGVYGLYRSNR